MVCTGNKERSGCGRSTAGFSLVELLIVLAIIGLLIGASVTVVNRGLLASRDTRALEDLVTGLREAHILAVRESRDVVVGFDLAARTWGRDDLRDHVLPQGWQVSLITAGSEAAGVQGGATGSGQGGAIRFFPDGSATGGRLDIRTRREMHRIDVGWVTGRIDHRMVGDGEPPGRRP